MSPAPARPLRPLPPKACGRIETFQLGSFKLAQCNPLGDAESRTVSVYLPADYDHAHQRRYPLLVHLPAYTSSGPAQLAWRNHGENLSQRLDRLIECGAMPSIIVAIPDTYTSLGGNQFVDTEAIGYWGQHLVEELIPETERRYRTIAEPAGRGLFGKSSGGFGALHLASQYPGQFGAIASHAGDCGFDRVYLRDFPVCCDELAAYDGDVEAFVRSFWRARRPGHSAFHTMMILCLAASYSPRPGRALNLELPFNLETARLDEQIWQRWLAFDPVRYDARRMDRLRAMNGVWIDAGNRDQYFIHYGTRELARLLDNYGVEFHFEEFDGTHSGMDWRLDLSLPWLAKRLKQD